MKFGKIAVTALALVTAANAMARVVHADPVHADEAPLRNWSPVGVSLVNHLAFPPSDWNVYGLNIDILTGSHPCVYGIDLGVFADWIKEEGCGFQITACFNSADGWMRGVQLSLFNSASDIDGLQIGFLNNAKVGSGVQIGAINLARQFNGLQIGVVNVNSRSACKFLPVANFAF